ncbi:MAG: Nramp family divalent metal transporter [Vicinamibacterales bacterium]
MASGVGLASGEFVLWPYIASQVGLGFLWGALAGVAIQWFLNLEIERYTLATGETALTGFSRLWRPAGLAFAAAVVFANAWPGWATSSATLLTFLIGGDRAVIAAIMLVTAGAILTLAPVVYTALERLIVIKVAAIGILAGLALWLVIEPASWPALAADAVSGAGRLPPGVSLPIALGAIAFAGAGGGQNLCQSNWIRDKGFGMGRYVPRLTSPITGRAEPAVDSRACVFTVDDEGLGRWRRWWRFANVEQALTFVVVTIVTIVFTSMLAWSTLHGRPNLPNTIDFLRIEGDVLAARGGLWFGRLFWAVGAYSLFAASVGVIDYTARLAADVLKWTYLRRTPIAESGLYAGIVWTLVGSGCAILLAGLDQPIVLLVISACSGAVMMCAYSVLLIILNRRTLPRVIAIPPWRATALVLAAVFFGGLAAVTIAQQLQQLLER